MASRVAATLPAAYPHRRPQFRAPASCSAEALRSLLATHTVLRVLGRIETPMCIASSQFALWRTGIRTCTPKKSIRQALPAERKAVDSPRRGYCCCCWLTDCLSDCRWRSPHAAGAIRHAAHRVLLDLAGSVCNMVIKEADVESGVVPRTTGSSAPARPAQQELKP